MLTGGSERYTRRPGDLEERCSARSEPPARCYRLLVQLVADRDVVEFVRSRGGRLFLTMSRGCCNGGVRWLETSTEPKGRRRFERVLAADGLEVWAPEGMRLPDDLEVRLRRFPRRVEAYWDGCAWVL